MVKLKQNDWKMLFPTETFMLGNTKLNIAPLKLESIPNIIKDGKTLISKLKSKDISMGNYGDNLEDVVSLLIAEAPGIISEMAGLDKEDVVKLPISIAVALTTKCIEVNIDSQQDLLKNLVALVEKSTQVMTMTQGILES